MRPNSHLGGKIGELSFHSNINITFRKTLPERSGKKPCRPTYNIYKVTERSGKVLRVLCLITARPFQDLARGPKMKMNNENFY